MTPKRGWLLEEEAAQDRDAARFAYLTAQGYTVVVIWECELEKDPEWVRTLLRRCR